MMPSPRPRSCSPIADEAPPSLPPYLRPPQQVQVARGLWVVPAQRNQQQTCRLCSECAVQQWRVAGLRLSRCMHANCSCRTPRGCLLSSFHTTELSRPRTPATTTSRPCLSPYTALFIGGYGSDGGRRGCGLRQRLNNKRLGKPNVSCGLSYSDCAAYCGFVLPQRDTALVLPRRVHSPSPANETVQ